jgi:tetratricopeptide (TPR) repeat protein
LSDGEPTKEDRGAAAKLEAARLASRPDGRWRLLAPIRETLLADFPPEAADRARLVKPFLARGADGGQAGTDRWSVVGATVIAEAGNLDAMIAVAAREPELPTDLSRAASGLGQLHQSQRFHDSGDVLGEAHCIRRLGDIALYRSDFDSARQRYEAALPLYQKVGSVLGEAACIGGLGDIALRRSDHDGARQRYEAALPLYKKVGNLLGEANCIRGLGEIALASSDHDGASQLYEAALSLFQKVGDLLSEANCIGSLGDLALSPLRS